MKLETAAIILLILAGVGTPIAAGIGMYRNHLIYQHCIANGHPDYWCTKR